MKKTFKALLLLSCVTLLAGCGGGSSTSSSTTSTSTSTSTSTPTPVTKYTVQTVGWSIKGGTNFSTSEAARTELKNILDSKTGIISSVEISTTNSAVLSQNFGTESESVGFTIGSAKNLGEITINFSKKLRFLKLDCTGYWKTWSSSGGGKSFDKEATLDIYCDGNIEGTVPCIQTEDDKPGTANAETSSNVGWSKITLKNQKVNERVIINSIEFGY